MSELIHAEFLGLKAKRDEQLSKFYCLRLLRTLFASEQVKAIGANALMIIQWVALREDELRYRAPVLAWNNELNNILGFQSPKQIQVARNRAIASGWLFYYRRHDRAMGEYFAMIPMRFSDLAYQTAPLESVPKTEQEAEQESLTCSENGAGTGTGAGTGSGTPSIPNPIPSFRRRNAERFIPPSVQDVQGYVETNGLKIEAERFVDFYETKGWMVGQNKMRNWQAAVRNWARGQRDQSGKILSPKTNKEIEYVN